MSATAHSRARTSLRGVLSRKVATGAVEPSKRWSPYLTKRVSVRSPSCKPISCANRGTSSGDIELSLRSGRRSRGFTASADASYEQIQARIGFDEASRRGAELGGLGRIFEKIGDGATQGRRITWRHVHAGHAVDDGVGLAQAFW